MSRIESKIRRVRWKCNLLRLVRMYNESSKAVWWNRKRTRLIDGHLNVVVDEAQTSFEDTCPYYSIQGMNVSNEDIISAFEKLTEERQAQILDICKRRGVLEDENDVASTILPSSLARRLIRLHKIASIYDTKTNRSILFPFLAIASTSDKKKSNASYVLTSRDRIEIKVQVENISLLVKEGIRIYNNNTSFGST